MHVVELINVLEANGIPYKTQSRMGVVLGVAALALCAAGAVLGVFMWKKKGRPRGTGQRAVPLVQFVQAGRRLAPAETAAAVAAALQEKGAQAHSLCAPQCVLVRGNGIELVKKTGPITVRRATPRPKFTMACRARRAACIFTVRCCTPLPRALCRQISPRA